jgi:hypothetical protein
MSLISWISSNPDAVATVVGGAALWIYNKARGKKSDDLWDRLLAVARQQFPKLLADPKAHENAHKVVEDALWAKIERLGIKKTPVLDKLVDEIVDHALGELAGKLMDRDLSKYIETSKRTVEILKTAAEPAS